MKATSSFAKALTAASAAVGIDPPLSEEEAALIAAELEKSGEWVITHISTFEIGAGRPDDNPDNDIVLPELQNLCCSEDDEEVPQGIS